MAERGQGQAGLLLAAHGAILVLALLCPPTVRLRRELFGALIVASFVALYRARPVATDPDVDPAALYSMATLWVLSLRVLTIVVHSAPSPEHAHYRPAIERPGDAAAYPVLPKLAWALSLLCAPRGVGWNAPSHGVRDTAQLPRFASRGAYLRWAARRLVLLVLVLDGVYTWTRLQPFALPPDDPRFRLMADPAVGPAHRLAGVLANGVSGAAFLQLVHVTMSVLAVGVLGHAPRAWPPLFGDVRRVWSLRRLWGYCWHQMLRSSLVPWGAAACRLLRLPPGSLAASAVVVTIAFALSGTGHALAMHTTDPALGAGALCFFLLQAVGIVLENLVCLAYARARCRWAGDGAAGDTEQALGRAIGRAWLLAWIAWTGPMQGNEFVRNGMYRQGPLPFQPVGQALCRLLPALGYAGGDVNLGFCQ